MNRKMLGAGVLLVAPAVAAAVTVTAMGGRLGCNPAGQLVGRTVHFCGPATAHLSVFPGVTFRKGTCSRKPDGRVTFSLKMGTRTPNAKTNGGLAYFGLTVTGPLSHPTGGGVIAYWKGRRWGGPGVSFSGNARAGRFSARGTNGSKGTASGSFHC